MSLIERFREAHQGNVYEKPIKKSERAPIARGLLDVIDLYLDNTPEYLRALNERQTQIGDDPKTTTLPIEYDTKDGHFSIRKVKDFQSLRGVTTNGYSIIFAPKTNGEDSGDNRIVLNVSVESNTPIPADRYGHLHVGPLPYDIGNFSLVNAFAQPSEDKLIPNSPRTRDEIMKMIPVLLPTLVRNKANNVSER